MENEKIVSSSEESRSNSKTTTVPSLLQQFRAEVAAKSVENDSNESSSRMDVDDIIEIPDSMLLTPTITPTTSPERNQTSEKEKSVVTESQPEKEEEDDGVLHIVRTICRIDTLDLFTFTNLTFFTFIVHTPAG